MRIFGRRRNGSVKVKVATTAAAAGGAYVLANHGGSVVSDDASSFVLFGIFLLMFIAAVLGTIGYFHIDTKQRKRQGDEFDRQYAAKMAARLTMEGYSRRQIELVAAYHGYDLSAIPELHKPLLTEA